MQGPVSLPHGLRASIREALEAASLVREASARSGGQGAALSDLHTGSHLCVCAKAPGRLPNPYRAVTPPWLGSVLSSFLNLVSSMSYVASTWYTLHTFWLNDV